MNNKVRSIETVFAPPPPHMVGDGFRVHNFFPNAQVGNKKRMSPFFLMDYGSKVEFGPSEQPRGVSVHPHAGFETVTIAYHGRIAHHDSAGNSGIIGEGDVQWMTAGSGLLHKEYHEKEYSRKGGLFQMVQLWVNLPAQHKNTSPKYQEITNARMGVYQLPDNNGTVEVIAGNYENVKGPAFTFTPMHVMNLRLKKDGNLKLEFPANFNTGLLVVEGAVSINDQHIDTDHFALMANDGEIISVKASEDAIVLVLSGEPIDGPIAAYGPFVMNTWKEVEKAIEDANSGKYGVLED